MLLRFRTGSELTKPSCCPLVILLGSRISRLRVSSFFPSFLPSLIFFFATRLARPLCHPLAPSLSLPSRYPAKASHVRACSAVHVFTLERALHEILAGCAFIRDESDRCLPHPPESRAPTLLVLNYARGTLLFSPFLVPG